MLDVNLLREHYFRGPITQEQQDELFAALRDSGIGTCMCDLTNSKGGYYAYFIDKSIFSENYYLTFKIICQPGGWNISSHFKEIKFEDLYIPEENMDFSKELFDLLGV